VATPKLNPNQRRILKMAQRGLSVLFSAARRLGIGRTYLRYRRLRATGLVALTRTAWARRTILPLIFEAKPIASVGQVEVHTLLNHPKVTEAAWALYSFAFFLGAPCKMVIHDDGSLTHEDATRLNQLFPGIRIISRAEADSLVLNELARRGLKNCLRLRQSLIFALKLFDPFFFGDTNYFFLLDSDILFYRRSSIINEHLASGVPLFGKDVMYSLALSPVEFEVVTESYLSHPFNAGFIGVPRKIVDLELIERWLEHASFWERQGEKASYYAEQTVWAGLLSRNKASVLDESFVVSPRGPVTESTVGAHYCGFGFPSSLFYWCGVPYAARELAKAGVLPAAKGGA
jgi:hypothetical protein